MNWTVANGLINGMPANTLARSLFHLGEMGRYWLNQHLSPLEFISNSIGPEVVTNPGSKLRLAIALMDPNRIYYDTDRKPEIERAYSYLYIGCGTSASSLLQEQSNAMDDISSGASASASTWRSCGSWRKSGCTARNWRNC